MITSTAIRRPLVGLILATSLILGALPAAAEDGPAKKAVANTVDVVILRPLSAVLTVAGMAPFLVSVPFLAPAGDLGSSWDVFVAAPYDYTVTRELGDF